MLGSNGYLPTGRHVVTPEDVQTHFVDSFPESVTRARLYARWRRHWASLDSVLPILSQWVDGSYVTSKVDPGDIDVITFLDGEAFDNLAGPIQDMAAALLAGKNTKAVWGIDSYPVFVFPDGHPSKSNETTASAEWDAWWSRVRDDDDQSKGYLEVRP